MHKCVGDPVAEQLYGCARPAQKLSRGKWTDRVLYQLSVEGTVYQFNRHPSLYISASIRNLLTEVLDNEEQKAHPPLKTSTARYRECRQMYFKIVAAAEKLRDALKT